MKRFYSAVLATLAALAVVSPPAHAAYCVPQHVFDSTTLQNRLATFGETTINPLTQQQEGLVWGSSVSTNSLMTIQFEVAGNPHGNEFGIATLNAAGNAVTGVDPIFPAVNLGTGWFAVASFRPGNVLKVTLFDPSATPVGPSVIYSNVNRQLFAYYIKNTNGTFFSHAGFNLDGKPHAVVYAGTGQNAGCWWLSWEDTMDPAPTANYDDGLLFLESLNPTPVSRATWSSVKSRFR